MDSITSEGCFNQVTNKFDLVMLSIERAKQLYNGYPPLVEKKSSHLSTALEEISTGKITVNNIQSVEKNNLSHCII